MTIEVPQNEKISEGRTKREDGVNSVFRRRRANRVCVNIKKREREKVIQ